MWGYIPAMRKSISVSLSLGLCAVLGVGASCGDDGGGNGDGGANVDAASNGDGGQTVDAAPAADALSFNCTPTSGTNLTTQEIATGLARPVLVTAPAGDPRLFVVEQPGRIRIIKDGTLLPTPFLDIAGPVNDNGNEQGLLGLAFHPNYASNGRFFVNYTATTPGNATVVAEYQVSADADVATATETRLLTIPQFATNHNGGMIEFGPDGYLYIGMGDGGGGGDPQEQGQDNTTLLGSMLRIDVNGAAPYAIPPSNPFADSANGTNDPRPEIWAIGVRNPWRFSFDTKTGDLYIGDVGQNVEEEIDVQPAASSGGENYGWDHWEGTNCYEPPAGGCGDPADFDQPVATHTHADSWCSITGGSVYRGSCFPDINGWYFYIDYCKNELWKFVYSGGAATQHAAVPGSFGSNVTSIHADATGELYLTAFNGNGSNGSVLRLIVGN